MQISAKLFIHVFFLGILTGLTVSHAQITINYELKGDGGAELRFTPEFATRNLQVLAAKQLSYLGNGDPQWDSDPTLLTPTSNGDYVLDSPGIYLVQFIDEVDNLGYNHWTTVWEQQFYVPYDKPYGYKELAKEYAPVLVSNVHEAYFPVDLDEIWTQLNAMDEPTLVDTNDDSLSFSSAFDLLGFLVANGNSRFLVEAPEDLKELTGHDSNITIYYDVALVDGKTFLSYYLFYAYDPKVPGIVGSLGKHVLDRESITIVFDSNMQPEGVLYGAHKPGQRLSFRGCSQVMGEPLLTWKSGVIYVSWDNVPKLEATSTSLLLFLAQGSHAIFPVPGWYTVNIEGTHLFDLYEYAGNRQENYVLPSNIEDLDVTGANQFLTFSGDWIDVTGLGNEKFPPFIRNPPLWGEPPSAKDVTFDKNLYNPFSANPDNQTPRTKIGEVLGECLGYVHPTVVNNIGVDTLTPTGVFVKQGDLLRIEVNGGIIVGSDSSLIPPSVLEDNPSTKILPDAPFGALLLQVDSGWTEISEENFNFVNNSVYLTMQNSGEVVFNVNRKSLPSVRLVNNWTVEELEVIEGGGEPLAAQRTSQESTCPPIKFNQVQNSFINKSYAYESWYECVCISGASNKVANGIYGFFASAESVTGFWTLYIGEVMNAFAPLNSVNGYVNQLSDLLYRENVRVYNRVVSSNKLLSPLNGRELQNPVEWVIHQVTNEQTIAERVIQTLPSNVVASLNENLANTLAQFINQELEWAQNMLGEDLDYANQHHREAVGIALGFTKLGLTQEDYELYYATGGNNIPVLNQTRVCSQ